MDDTTSGPAPAPVPAGETGNPPAPPAAAARPAAAHKPRKPRRPRPKAIINENGCTGCEACVTVCPVDCIVKILNPAAPELNPV